MMKNFIHYLNYVEVSGDVSEADTPFADLDVVVPNYKIAKRKKNGLTESEFKDVVENVSAICVKIFKKTRH
ncbi:hypothetical protein [Candidatus Coxiella mudrowiae]|uniref:hypothetical protein n=1 Tax=Candidatus Coxiella mudrowiae TaxID=2054173 RepID=UPI0012FF47F3|nr:hypothetical protein [Candidatus Coxiella mudrowiae]